MTQHTITVGTRFKDNENQFVVIDFSTEQLRAGTVVAAQVMEAMPLSLKIVNTTPITGTELDGIYSMSVLLEALGNFKQHSGAKYILDFLAKLTDENRPTTTIEI